MPFVICDGGRLRVHADYLGLLQRHGLATFAALSKCNFGTVVRTIGTRQTRRIVLEHELGRPGAATACYLKRHGPLPWREYLKCLLRANWPVRGARPEWRAILKFHAAGIPTMTPIAFGEHRGHSLLLTLGLEDSDDLKPLVGNASVGALRTWSQELAGITRRMHDTGLHHQDFYLNHVLASRTDGSLRVIDLGRVRKRPHLSLRWIIKDLGQLNYSARTLPCRTRLRFLRQYLGRPLCRADRSLIRAIAVKAWWIDRHTRRRGL